MLSNRIMTQFINNGNAMLLLQFPISMRLQAEDSGNS
jgi:hypothetical protein